MVLVMDNFEVLQQSNVIFGAEEERQVGKLVKKYSDTCLVVVPDGAPFENLIHSVRSYLEAEGIKAFELSGIVANPRLSKAKEGIELVRNNKIGFVLAVGGGSVMDTVKYISYAAYWEGNPLEITLDTAVKTPVIPHGAVVTLSGTGSELSYVSVMVDDSKQPETKKVLMNNCLFFDFCIVNPELTYTLPERQLAAGVMDGISHCLESYDGNSKEEPIFEGYFEAIMKTLLIYGPKAMKEPLCYEYRSKISLAAMIANNQNFCTSGVTRDLSVHNIESFITTACHGTHGVILGVITPAFIKYVYKRNPYPFVNFSVRCLGVDFTDKSEDAIVEEGAERLKSWIKEMKLPTSFTELGITYQMAIDSIPDDYVAGKVYKLNKTEIKELLEGCK